MNLKKNLKLIYNYPQFSYNLLQFFFFLFVFSFVFLDCLPQVKNPAAGSPKEIVRDIKVVAILLSPSQDEHCNQTCCH